MNDIEFLIISRKRMTQPWIRTQNQTKGVLRFWSAKNRLPSSKGGKVRKRAQRLGKPELFKAL